MAHDNVCMTVHTFSIEKIPLIWMILACLIFSVAVLLGVIAIAHPFIRNTHATVSFTQPIAQNNPTSVSIQTSSSDSSSLYPMLPQ